MPLWSCGGKFRQEASPDLIRILELEGRIPYGTGEAIYTAGSMEKRGYGARQIAMYNTGSAGASRRSERTGRTSWGRRILNTFWSFRQRPSVPPYSCTLDVFLTTRHAW